jgi:hypothetical protein
MTASTYKPWLRNLYVRRLFILFGVPVAVPAIVAFVAIKSARDWLPVLIEAWQPERFDGPQ